MFFIPFGLVTVEIDCSVNPLITNLAVRLGSFEMLNLMMAAILSST